MSEIASAEAGLPQKLLQELLDSQPLSVDVNSLILVFMLDKTIN